MAILGTHDSNHATAKPVWRQVVDGIRVLKPSEVHEDPSLGPNLTLPEMPDFEAIALAQGQEVSDLATFHEMAISFFTPKMDNIAIEYCHDLRKKQLEYKTHLDTTYRAGLMDELERVRVRLAQIPFAAANEAITHETKEGSIDDEYQEY